MLCAVIDLKASQWLGTERRPAPNRRVRQRPHRRLDRRAKPRQTDMDKRFDEMLKRHDTHFLWLIAFIATMAGLSITAIRFL